MARTIDVLLSPAEYAALGKCDLAGSLCVVFDVLRATSVMATALAGGAIAIVPVAEIADAVTLKHANPDWLLGGERGGLRITAAQSGGVDFDLGNSPREYTPERVAGKTIVTTTTNGTRALRACTGAAGIVAASFLNLSACATFAATHATDRILLVCAGTGESAAFEDALAAGAFCDLLMKAGNDVEMTDAAWVAWQADRHTHFDPPATARFSLNARRLLAIPSLSDDVEFCLQRDHFTSVPVLGRDGMIRNAA
ncbi:MAG TPA: 2-phosphosulfolactate phosphatase [Verrucomicrobiota bacterium]|nr:2-phosphosulfolactate phosphatase [Verrucomicrobiota bacterium]